MKCRFAAATIALLHAGVVFAFGDWLSDLRSPDIATRRSAVEAIQTLDDARIPGACLSLLRDAGDSIRRQAARAIGSRFEEIPAAQRGKYVEELRRCAEAGPDDVTLLCQRAIGLLTQKYAFPSFSISPSGKWILYERRRLPVIANVVRQSHFLLSPYDPAGAPDPTGLLKMNVTNESAPDLFAPRWQPGGDAVAFAMETIQARFYNPVLVWTAAHPEEVQVLGFEKFKPILGSRPKNWGTSTQFAGWQGDHVLVHIFDYGDPHEMAVEPDQITVSYNIRNGRIAVVGREPRPDLRGY